MVRGVRGARGVVDEERPVRRDGLHVVDELHRLVGEVHRQVVTLFRAAGLVDRVVVVDQVRVPLIGLGTEEAVEPVEPSSQRPTAPGRGEVHLVLRRQVPLADRRRAEPSFDEHLGQRCAGRRDVPVAVGETGRGFGDARHPVDGVVAPGQEA
jgi:hypothetical protein